MVSLHCNYGFAPTESAPARHCLSGGATLIVGIPVATLATPARFAGFQFFFTLVPAAGIRRTCDVEVILGILTPVLPGPGADALAPSIVKGILHDLVFEYDLVLRQPEKTTSRGRHPSRSAHNRRRASPNARGESLRVRFFSPCLQR